MRRRCQLKSSCLITNSSDNNQQPMLERPWLTDKRSPLLSWQNSCHHLNEISIKPLNKYINVSLISRRHCLNLPHIKRQHLSQNCCTEGTCAARQHNHQNLPRRQRHTLTTGSRETWQPHAAALQPQHHHGLVSHIPNDTNSPSWAKRSRFGDTSSNNGLIGQYRCLYSGHGDSPNGAWEQLVHCY